MSTTAEFSGSFSQTLRVRPGRCRDTSTAVRRLGERHRRRLGTPVGRMWRLAGWAYWVTSSGRLRASWQYRLEPALEPV